MKRLLVMMFVMVIGGCSTVEVNHSALDPSTIGSMSYFAWVEGTGENEAVRAANPAVERQVKKAVERELAMKGYTRVAPEHADFLISWFGKVDEKVKEQSIAHFYRSYGYGTLAGALPGMVAEGASEQSYKKGTLVVDALDGKSQKLLWRGVGTDTIVDDMSEQQVAALISKSVRLIIADFPNRR